MNKIGLNINDIEIGKEVYYYPWYDEITKENAEPIKTKITYGVRLISNINMCHVEDVSGAVALSHLSFNYIPKHVLTAKKRKSKERYAEYLRVADCYNSFHHFLTGKP